MKDSRESTGVLKRTFDIGFSTLVLAGLSPVLLLIALSIKTTTPGSAVYRQERLGKNRKPFVMYKFRTMVADAEKNGPQLAKPGDPRITKVGKLLRKYHIDELLQFWNILKGDMTVVGPRPEREVYVKEIEKFLPEYSAIFDVSPGITSAGMVNYGYASDINGMIERSKFDLDKLKSGNPTDIKIIIKTIKTILKGKGV